MNSFFDSFLERRWRWRLIFGCSSQIEFCLLLTLFFVVLLVENLTFVDSTRLIVICCFVYPLVLSIK